eukprot:CAMPEP_0114250126 /NCGR_PEP_ID=MMETSP0058-20121206/14529_1 /TAXON_ID=36894 /ORGANISM="Pyramimonas parkeae, CCMP726" /LENGTH=166 /DNA_ID=CAMNT_0001363757 /DNA_START=92 /DNA_END=595 /DNA_ORIENTATION=-
MAFAVKIQSVSAAFKIAGFVLLLVGVAAGKEDEAFNKNIPWLTTRKDLDGIMQNGSEKPTMVLISKTWCGACKNLKSSFNSGNSESKEIEKLAESFNMVNLVDSEEPNDAAFSPDGGYIPRIFFLNREGKLDDSISNTMGNPKYKYFYSALTQVKGGMKSALRKFS